MQELRLKKHEDRRVRIGHLWIFSNEVDTRATPLKSFAPGEPARVVDARGNALGMGYVNPASLISCRMLSRKPDAVPDRDFFLSRLGNALELRTGKWPTPFYRLVHGEGDLLPGLVVDRFGDVLSIQANTAGMDSFLPVILDCLDELCSPRGVILRNDSASRALEGLAQSVATQGEVPEDVLVEEEGARFLTPLSRGQKTGFYYDMSRIRMRAARWGADCDAVLDCFSYVGVLGVRAAMAGAGRVLCVDGSRTALEYAQENARINGVQDSLETACGDAFELLAQEEPRTWGMVSIDPPAFIKRKKDAKTGARAYQRLNRLAAALVRDKGFLLTASCSQHFKAEDLRRAALAGTGDSRRSGQILWQGFQSPDHPVHPAMEESAYLKAFFLRLLPD